ncbi:MAG: hypothetical protein Q4G42_05870 [Neisseria sp.]|nr:hypothetical protein [Neisseria sp.]
MFSEDVLIFSTLLKPKTSNRKKPLFHPRYPLEAAIQKAVFAEKGLACLSGGEADTSSSPPHKRLFEREVLAKPKPAPWGRLSLLTFFDEAKKVGGFE